MLSRTETERLAGMASALRPDWTIRSLVSLIHVNLSHRAYQDVALALAWIATDPTTATPGRLLEAGPWWLTAKPGTSSPDTMPGRVRCEKHPTERASNCRSCTGDRIGKNPDDEPATSIPTETSPGPGPSTERIREIFHSQGVTR